MRSLNTAERPHSLQLERSLRAAAKTHHSDIYVRKQVIRKHYREKMGKWILWKYTVLHPAQRRSVDVGLIRQHDIEIKAWFLDSCTLGSNPAPSFTQEVN